ncbi:MAG: [Fe-Fe] hydrogenase large subunit C-terminal domain-containing protein [Anaerovoracaceae bacterium]|jgi:iron only hydrogenase large subunit-like protein
MRLSEVIRLIDGKLFCEDEAEGKIIMSREYSHAIASDLMSNVMLDTRDDSILITSLVNSQVIRASEMMNITCIIITCGKTVTETMVELSANRNIALVETQDTTFTVCGKLHNCGVTEGPLHLDHGHVTSIRLDRDLCIGCIHCARHCSTEAIRVRDWKAQINPERCVECGMCVKVCPRHAIAPIVDTLDALKEYDYKVAIPSSAFYSQFKNVKSRNHLLTSLKKIGFDDVYEEAIGAEMISYATKKKIRSGKAKFPLISSSCPAILNLIEIKFPNLIDHVLEYRTAVEVTAEIAREETEKKYPGKRVGIFFIAPCTAEMSYVKESDEVVETEIDEMVAISELYRPVSEALKILDDEDVEDLERSGVMGLRWASPGGESLALTTDKFIAVDGIQEAIDIFEQLDNEKLEDVEFIEAEACAGACSCGALTLENNYISKVNLKKLVDEAKEKYGYAFLNTPGDERKLQRNRPLRHRPVYQLDKDLNISLKKMEEIGRVLKTLPGVDCGVCGSPTCKAFAEDVVRGLITEKACVLLKRRRER